MLKLSVGLPTDKVQLGDEFNSGEGVMELARGAEEVGFDAVHVTDHPFPEDTWMASGGHHALDPWVPLSFAAAATTTIGLQTHILVLPYRNPFLTAKSVVSLDVLSGGRVIVGVAAGYLEPEFTALGVDYAERNELTDEAIVAMKRAWTEDGISMQGRHFSVAGHSMLPKPRQKPHPPIWIGGNSKRAIRRAVDLADGWIPIPNFKTTVARRKTPAIENLDDLRGRIAYAREYAEGAGRTAPLDIVFVPFGLGDFRNPTFSPEEFLDNAGRLQEMGVTWLSVNLPSDNRAVLLESMRRFSKKSDPSWPSPKERTMPLHPQAEAIARAFAERMATASGAAPTIQERRAAVDASPRVPGPDMARVEDRTVEGPNGDVPVRVLVPHDAGPLPVVMYFHGGGWVIGTVDSSEAMARSIAEASGCIVVSVEYRLSPEHKFPMGLEDCYAVTRWAAEEAASFGGDGSRLAVSGDSSGGNLAAAVCLVARDRGAPAIAYQALIYPVLDRNFETRSYEDNANGYLLTRRMMVSNWRDYLDREETAANPYAAPVQSKDVSGLPPAYVLTAEYDPLRDEGEAYAGMLERAGVPTRYVCYAGMVHGFFGFTGQIDMAREAVADVGAAVRAALAR